MSLLPPGLARKRVWNKKYPICITLAEGEVGEESVIEGQEEEERAERHAAPDHQLPVTLHLFGRTGREKEEWFQRFASASQAGAKSSVSGEENTGRKMFRFVVKYCLQTAKHYLLHFMSVFSLFTQKHLVAETPSEKAQRSCGTCLEL